MFMALFCAAIAVLQRLMTFVATSLRMLRNSFCYTVMLQNISEAGLGMVVALMIGLDDGIIRVISRLGSSLVMTGSGDRRDCYFVTQFSGPAEFMIAEMAVIVFFQSCGASLKSSITALRLLVLFSSKTQQYLLAMMNMR